MEVCTLRVSFRSLDMFSCEVTVWSKQDSSIKAWCYISVCSWFGKHCLLHLCTLINVTINCSTMNQIAPQVMCVVTDNQTVRFRISSMSYSSRDGALQWDASVLYPFLTLTFYKTTTAYFLTFFRHCMLKLSLIWRMLPALRLSGISTCSGVSLHTGLTHSHPSCSSSSVWRPPAEASAW